MVFDFEFVFLVYVQKRVTGIGSSRYIIVKSNHECGRNELPLKFQEVT